MKEHIQGIDHVVIAVRNLDQAAATFRRLGFTLTPRGRHTMGSENHCAMFPSDYFELLAVPADHPVTQYYSDYLHHGDGLAALALKTDDATGFYEELQQSEIRSEVPVDFSRPVVLHGEKRDAAFRITQVDIAETPGGRAFACQHFTRDVVWRPEYISHPNGAIGLAAITLLADEESLDSVSAKYARLFCLKNASHGKKQNLRRIDTGNISIEISTPQEFYSQHGINSLVVRPLPHFAALQVRVESVEQTLKFLHQANITFIEKDGELVVSSAITQGPVVIFRAV